MGNSWLSLVVYFCAIFFPLDVLGEIWDLIESVSEEFPTYSFIAVGFEVDAIFKMPLLHSKSVCVPRFNTIILDIAEDGNHAILQ